MVLEGLLSSTDWLFPCESLRVGSKSSPTKVLLSFKLVLDFDPQFMKYFSGGEYADEKISSSEEIWRRRINSGK